MADIAIKITNLPQIRAAFRKSPTIMARNLNGAIKKTVLQISRTSRINTPVDTGRLRASTYTKFAPLKGEVGTNTDYDRFVHDGTKFMRARPYLKSAVDEEAFNTEKFFTEAVDKTLNEIGKMT